ncbi:hypothetical protein A8990_11286 [Paenibacillus taihuensis]|uniref:LysR substrate-binding domain-containing protein n=2 Tax=Paenibacillus taihuensis TaxID=1156355 RepID=A0A3D9SA48_9BACL|nr:hypothetical protein A8990_11286 [Paenibacillus taihuensis]
MTRTRLAVCFARESRFFNLDFVTPEDLRNEEVVIHNSVQGKAWVSLFHKDSPILLASNNIGILKDAVKRGRACSVVHEFMFNSFPEAQTGEIFMVPLKDKNYFYEECWLTYPIQAGVSDEAKQFMKYVAVEMEKQAQLNKRSI